MLRSRLDAIIAFDLEAVCKEERWRSPSRQEGTLAEGASNSLRFSSEEVRSLDEGVKCWLGPCNWAHVRARVDLTPEPCSVDEGMAGGQLAGREEVGPCSWAHILVRSDFTSEPCSADKSIAVGQLAGREELLQTPSDVEDSRGGLGKFRLWQTSIEAGRQFVQRRLAFTHTHPRHFELMLLHEQQ